MVLAADPCVSGVPVGKRPGPYSALVATGPHRGTSHCYICDNGDRPAVVVFARTPDAALGKLVKQIDQAVIEHRKAELNGWVTFLSDDQPALDPKIVAWAREHGIGEVPLAVFEDADGPPTYKIARDADVTVMLFVNQRVTANFAFRTGELNQDRVAEILREITKLLESP
jgi:hypothetical protein